jgi:hypothetical protein
MASDEPTLEDVRREFPGWSCWRGNHSGAFYARRHETPRDSYDVKGEDALDLRDRIIRAESLTGDGLKPSARRLA